MRTGLPFLINRMTLVGHEAANFFWLLIFEQEHGDRATGVIGDGQIVGIFRDGDMAGVTAHSAGSGYELMVFIQSNDFTLFNLTDDVGPSLMGKNVSWVDAAEERVGFLLVGVVVEN
jgi:hypothetical protein